MRRILFVHDQEQIKEMISEYIRLHGFLVDQAGDATSAFKLFTETQYDLVICSETLHPIDGVEFLTKIRNSAEEDKRNVLMMLVGREASDFKLSGFLAKQNVNFITFYRRISIWIDKINVILS